MIFGVAKTDVQMLNDTDLRELVARLCEAELEKNGVSTKFVDWGGAQQAPDGGSDVTVSSPVDLAPGYIPCKHTVFQVKQSKMGNAAIKNEMCPKPKKEIRPIFHSLNNDFGGYVIVSAGTDAVGQAISSITSKMNETLESNSLSQVHVDFYSCQQIASWVNTFPSVIAWMKHKVGTSITGWQPYDNWSNQAQGLDAEYVFDEKSCIEHEKQNYIMESGINIVRSKLILQGRSIRIIGMSGVGKTRFLQSLFDERVGEKALRKSDVIYGDIGDSLSPDPSALVEHYIKTKKQIIIIVDNCPSDLHKSLTRMCTKPESVVNVVTVEYDITEGEPEETDFFKLDVCSDEVIKKLLPKWNSNLTYSIAERIADLSGGNARLAKLLCEAVERYGAADSITDKELFNRLFWQRDNPNQDLQNVAEACSIVYSFDAVESNGNEINALANIADVNVQTFRRCISTLKKRGLLQERSIWRALLPHALANHLAIQALDYICLSTDNIKNENNKRLLDSFIRRLSYLYSDEKAIAIASELIKVMDISAFGAIYSSPFQDIESFSRLASIVPADALKIIEDNITCFTNEHSYSIIENNIARIISDIAYDANLFDRAVNVLCSLYLGRKHSSNNNNMIEHELLKLFNLFGSCTCATPEQRKIYVENLLSSKDVARQSIGIKLLKSALDRQTYISGNPNSNSFSQHQRDYGYWPATEKEFVDWYDTFLCLAIDISNLNSNIRRDIFDAVDTSFRGLLRDVRLGLLAVDFINKTRDIYFWAEGLMDAKLVLTYMEKSENDTTSAAKIENLNKIIEILEPRCELEFLLLCQTHSAYHMSQYGYLPDVRNRDAVGEIVIEKARIVGAHEQIPTSALLVFATKRSLYSDLIGRGLCLGCKNRGAFLDNFLKLMLELPSAEIDIGVLLGFLEELSTINSVLCDETLKVLIETESMLWFCPTLISYLSGDSTFDNLLKAIENENIHVRAFHNVWRSDAFKQLTNNQHFAFYEALCKKEGGVSAAIDIFHMHFYDKIEKSPLHTEAIQLGQYLLLAYDFSVADKNCIDYDITVIYKACFSSDEKQTKNLLEHIHQGSGDYPFSYSGLLEKIVSSHPILFLNEFLRDGDDTHFNLRWSARSEHDKNLIGLIDDDIILQWIRENADERCTKIVEIMPLMSNVNDTLSWKPIVYEMLDEHSNPLEFVSKLFDTLIPSSWNSYSRAGILESRTVLIKEFCTHTNAEISAFACEYLESFKLFIVAERKEDAEREKVRKLANERFE